MTRKEGGREGGEGLVLRNRSRKFGENCVSGLKIFGFTARRNEASLAGGKVEHAEREDSQQHTAEGRDDRRAVVMHMHLT
jgi:hypothetical protein